MRELAPRDTGDFIRSLSVEHFRYAGEVRYRIISNDPQLQQILKGTAGGYRGVPPWNRGPFAGWAIRHGFTTNISRYSLAKKVAVHGTNPAGSYYGKADWIKDALREAAR